MTPDRITTLNFIPAIVNSKIVTREIFGNIGAVSKTLFYLLAFVALMCFVYGVYRRIRFWKLGRKSKEKIDARKALKRFFAQVVTQKKIMGEGIASVAHILLFSGFVVLLIGTTLIAIEHYASALLGREASNPIFHKGAYFVIYEFVMDSFGIAMLVGCICFIKLRLGGKTLLGYNVLDWLVLGTICTLGITGYLIEGLRIIREQTPQAGFSFVGLAAAKSFEMLGVTKNDVATAHFILWWFHAVLALGLVAAIPYTRLMHAIAGLLNITMFENNLGTMSPVSIEEFEDTGRVGVGQLQDFTQPQLLGLDACVSCGRCENACPAYEAGKPLSPHDVVQDIRRYLNNNGTKILDSHKTKAVAGEKLARMPSLHGDTIKAETLWSCTTCSACVDVCPLGVNPLDLITDMRRYLVSEGQLRGSPAASLQKVQRSGNPWGLPADERFNWAEGLNVPTINNNSGFEVLYWVGCAASYDRRVQKVARSVVMLLQTAGINFAVLGSEERCTGESARRMGDEFLFQELAETNINTLKKYNVKKIITHCPHCFNSFSKDYPQFGGNYEVIHHSQYLAELIHQGKLHVNSELLKEDNGLLTFHDPCYLGRVNNITEPPRQLIQITLPQNGNRKMIEMERHGHKTSCCGAGGGRMWFDDAFDERIGRSRIEEALATGADTVAVACPFCMIMMSDGVAALDPNVKVRDIAELLINALGKDCSS